MDVIDWLLDSDPAIRWQAMPDLLDAPAAEVEAERGRVAREGWGARILDAQRPDGSWGGGANFPEWTGTKPTLALLRLLGPVPSDPRLQAAMDRVRANVRWEYDDLPFFDGEVEPCINGSLVALATYFGQDVRPVVERLLGEQMEDGGWNCEQENGSVRGSADTTINVLEGLLEFERATGGSPEITTARARGQAFLLDRGLLRRLSTGELMDEAFTRLHFPPRWHYDVLRALDYLRDAGIEPDERVDEAIELLRAKRDADGRWPLEATYAGEANVEMDDGDGRPSRWVTLKALRILRWYDAARGSRAAPAGMDGATGATGATSTP